MTVPAMTIGCLMEEAMAQRSRCALALPEIVTGIKELDCSILESTDKGLLLESAGKAAVGTHWIGQPVKGYLRIVLHRETAEELFYTFDSRINAASANPGGRAKLGLCQPETFSLGQRRKSLRVEPEPERVQNAFFWRYDREAGFAIDAPALRSNDFQNGAARLADISAGGLRLVLQLGLARSRGMDAAKGQRIVIHLDLDEPRLPGDHGFWMVAKVCHAVENKYQKTYAMGLEFLANGTLDPKLGKIRWQPVQDNVITPLADIFYLWHLDRHREMAD